MSYKDRDPKEAPIFERPRYIAEAIIEGGKELICCDICAHWKILPIGVSRCRKCRGEESRFCRHHRRKERCPKCQENQVMVQ